jgi:hypothetical protein
MPVALAATALWPPLSAVRIAYTLALVTAVDGSFGLKGQYYPLLYSYVMPYRGLRVPARFSIVVGLTLAVLAGLGVARIAERWPRYRAVLVSLSLGLTILEAAPRIELEPVWREPPPVYASLADEPTAVLAEFPLPTVPVEYFQDTRYLYFSTFHWRRLLNGNSGYFPKSYEELIERARDFPSDASVEYLKGRGVDYVTVHGAFMERGKFQATVTNLDRRLDMQLVAAAPWEGSESRLYKLMR